MTVTQRDNGWKALKKRLDAKHPSVKVGIFGDAAAAKANDSDKATVGQIANAHEHGLGVPRRSWLGGTVDANMRDILDGLRRGARAVMDPKAAPGLERALLAQTGQHIAGLARQRISSGISPALSARYLARKLHKYPGATTPLIASGQMWGAIGSVVEGSAGEVSAQRAAVRKAAKAALSRRRRARQLARASKRVARAGKSLSLFAKRNTKSAQRVARRNVRAIKRASKKLGRRVGKAFK